jgi:hypothetical protein
MFVALAAVYPFQVEDQLQPTCESPMSKLIFSIMALYDVLIATCVFYFSKKTRKIQYPANEFLVRKYRFCGFPLTGVQDIVLFLNSFLCLIFFSGYYSNILQANPSTRIRFWLIAGHFSFSIIAVLSFHLPKVIKHHLFFERSVSGAKINRISFANSSLHFSEDQIRSVEELHSRIFAITKTLAFWRDQEVPQIEETLLKMALDFQGFQSFKLSAPNLITRVESDVKNSANSGVQLLSFNRDEN